MEIKAIIVSAHHDWIAAPTDDNPSRKIQGVYDIELTVTEFNGTYEEVIDAHERNVTFKLVEL